MYFIVIAFKKAEFRDIMGLISLTFGTGKQGLSVSTMREVLYPKDNIKCPEDNDNKLEIIKVCTFYNCQDVYVVGKVVSGLVKEDMSCSFNGRKVDVGRHLRVFIAVEGQYWAANFL